MLGGLWQSAGPTLISLNPPQWLLPPQAKQRKQENLKAVCEGINEIVGQLYQIHGKHEAHETALSELQAAMDDISGTANRIEDQATQVNSTLEELDNQLTQVNSTLEELNNEVTQINSTLEEVKDHMP